LDSFVQNFPCSVSHAVETTTFGFRFLNAISKEFSSNKSANRFLLCGFELSVRFREKTSQFFTSKAVAIGLPKKPFDPRIAILGTRFCPPNTHEYCPFHPDLGRNTS
jgi:hypothetical protein